MITIAALYLFQHYTDSTSASAYDTMTTLKSVSLAYIAFGIITFLLQSLFGFYVGLFISAWALTILLMLGAQVWLKYWQSMPLSVMAMPQLVEPEQANAVEPPKIEKKVEKVLVIGGGGYIGSALVKRMLENGYKVRLLDLMQFGTEPIEDLLDNPNLEIHVADFRSVDAVLRAMRGIDAVVHLGGLVGDPACAYDEELTIDINLLATRMVAEVAKSVGVERFIFASTCSVYGAGDEMLNEHSELNPVSLYARTKIASEQMLRQLSDADFTPIILRFGTIYGLSGRTRFDLVINLLTAKGLIDGEITVFGGTQWRPFVHVQDAALGVFRALEAPLVLVGNETFNIGSNGQNYTIQQVGEIIHKMIPTAKLLNLGADSDPRNYRVDFSKARNVLGLIPEWTVEKGVSQVIKAFQDGKIDNYKDIKYSNVRFLKEVGMRYFSGEIVSNLNGHALETAPKQQIGTKTIKLDYDYDMPFVIPVNGNNHAAPNQLKQHAIQDNEKDYVIELIGAIANTSSVNGSNGAISNV
ncbi:MAG: NAD(P)-dependent oxidoreductase [Chloroflexota bacterium]